MPANNRIYYAVQQVNIVQDGVSDASKYDLIHGFYHNRNKIPYF